LADNPQLAPLGMFLLTGCVTIVDVKAKAGKAAAWLQTCLSDKPFTSPLALNEDCLVHFTSLPGCQGACRCSPPLHGGVPWCII